MIWLEINALKCKRKTKIPKCTEAEDVFNQVEKLGKNYAKKEGIFQKKFLGDCSVKINTPCDFHQ